MAGDQKSQKACQKSQRARRARSPGTVAESEEPGKLGKQRDRELGKLQEPEATRARNIKA